MGGGGSRRYDWETKVAAARDHVENGLTKTEAMARHGIASIASVGTLVPRVPGGRPGGAQAEAQGQAQRLEIQTGTHARASRRTGRPEGEGRVPGKTPGPAGVQVTRRERSAVVRLLAGRGHRLDHLLRIAGVPKSTYYHHLSRPAHVSRPDVEPMVREIWDGERVRPPAPMVHEFGTRISAKTVLGGHAPHGTEMRHPPEPMSQGRDGRSLHNLLKRDFERGDRRHRVQGRPVYEWTRSSHGT